MGNLHSLEGGYLSNKSGSEEGGCINRSNKGKRLGWIEEEDDVSLRRGSQNNLEKEEEKDNLQL